MAGVIVLDASALIALQSRVDKHHGWAMEFMKSTLEFDYAISALTYAEVQVQPARANLIEKYLENTLGMNLDVLSVETEDSSALAKIRAETNLQMPDAVVLHSAEKYQAGLATADKSLASAARKRGLRVYSPQD
jgi:predicted nucleic acid-binding protein